MDLELEDEDVRIAVRALGDMRNGNQPQKHTSSSSAFVFPQSRGVAAAAEAGGGGAGGAGHSPSMSSTASHTPALSLSLASTHPASSPPHTPPLEEDEDEDRRDSSASSNTNGGAGESAATASAYPSLVRMQSLPLVSGALRVYEAGKANSRVVQYTSSLVSTSLRHASSRLPAGSGERMDEFAGGMLDRLDKYRAAPPARKTLDGSREGPYEREGRGEYEEPGPYREEGRYARGEGERHAQSQGGEGRYASDGRYADDSRYAEREDGRYADNADARYPEDGRYAEREREREEGGRYREGGSRYRGYEYERDGGRERATSPFVAPPPPPPPAFHENGHGNGRARGKRREGAPSEPAPAPAPAGQQNGQQAGQGGQSQVSNGQGEQGERAVAQRSRWQAMLLEAGGLSAALSDESMRRLRYCLQWLQEAGSRWREEGGVLRLWATLWTRLAFPTLSLFCTLLHLLPCSPLFPLPSISLRLPFLQLIPAHTLPCSPRFSPRFPLPSLPFRFSFPPRLVPTHTPAHYATSFPAPPSFPIPFPVPAGSPSLLCASAFASSTISTPPSRTSPPWLAFPSHYPPLPFSFLRSPTFLVPVSVTPVCLLHLLPPLLVGLAQLHSSLSLLYATQHIDAQILILRDFIASLHPLPPPGQPHSLTVAIAEPELTPDHLRTLAHLRSDIVHTIRQVVGVVSKYAGGALPEPARGRVRGFILDLPKRFSAERESPGGTGGGASTSVGVSGTGTGTAARRGMRRERGAGASADHEETRTPAGSQPGSPHMRLRPLPLHHEGHSRRGSASTSAGAGGPVEAGKAMAAAQRVLTLATESLDMMRGVTAVVGDSLDRADAWVDRLRTVGIQRGMPVDGLGMPEG
ncbi:transcription factor Opi1-domain-containing protein, partial [Mycena epipterygia]